MTREDLLSLAEKKAGCELELYGWDENGKPQYRFKGAGKILSDALRARAASMGDGE